MAMGESTEKTPKRGGRGSSSFLSFLVVCCILAAVYFLFLDRLTATAPTPNRGPAPEIVNLTGQTFQRAADSGVLAIDFWAVWCGPCKLQAPIIDSLAARYSGMATIAKVDVDSEGALANRFNIEGIPTVVILKNGVEHARFVGLTQEDELSKSLRAVL